MKIYLVAIYNFRQTKHRAPFNILSEISSTILDKY